MVISDFIDRTHIIQVDMISMAHTYRGMTDKHGIHMTGAGT